MPPLVADCSGPDSTLLIGRVPQRCTRTLSLRNRFLIARHRAPQTHDKATGSWKWDAGLPLAIIALLLSLALLFILFWAIPHAAPDAPAPPTIVAAAGGAAAPAAPAKVAAPAAAAAPTAAV